MKILAISGSARASSTNTAMLRAVVEIAQPEHEITVFAGVADLPVFSPDLEEEPLPVAVQSFFDLISENDCVIVSSPEYIRAIPGGLKNAIDWLVSRDVIIDKPIALMHASHRGDDMLAQLRLVLSTVSQRFSQDVFVRFEFMKLSPDKISAQFTIPSNRAAVTNFLNDFVDFYS
ncbi:MAG: NADPH-dependent FMN reductase [Hyphomicrobiales bacterium]|uniref:NADPH-dependent FMN reductase n=1 Tax=Shimia thalassica TaxID=1715693 RepID=UPI0032999296